MNAQEAALHYPFDTDGGETLPASGRAIEIVPGIKWIRMSLPFALNHIHLWLLRDQSEAGAGWTVVDCCIDQDASRAQWEQIFVNELEGLPILRVIATHMHPDHLGLAHWLCERWSTQAQPCQLWISATDYSAARLAAQVSAGHGGIEAADFVAAHGIRQPEQLDLIRKRTGYYASMVPRIPASYVRLMDGQSLRIGAHDWHCIAGYGHAPEHIALHCKALNVLISGDMLLPRISTNISVYNLEPQANPLALFLQSLQRMTSLPRDTLVLPSHGKPFVHMHERIRQLQQHHAERLREVQAACRSAPQTAHDIVAIMFKRDLDLHQLTFAQGEALAHLHKLWFDGLLQREFDGKVYRFRASS